MVNEYCRPNVRPVTVVDVAGAVTVFVTLWMLESGRVAMATIVYLVTGSSETGSSQVTVADLAPAVASVISGVPGTPDNSTGPNDADVAPVPTALVADTVKE
jgi:hypothetical protein